MSKMQHTFEVLFIVCGWNTKAWEFHKVTIEATSPSVAAFHAKRQLEHGPRVMEDNHYLIPHSWRELVNGEFTPMSQDGEGCRSGNYSPCAINWDGDADPASA